MKELKAELLKYRRTFTGKLIVWIPLFFAVYAFVIGMIMENSSQAQKMAYTGTSWAVFLALVFNWWSFLFMPLGMGLFGTLVAWQEKRAGNWRVLQIHANPPRRQWIAKIGGMAVYSLFSSLVLILVTVVTGFFTAQGIMPFARIVVGALLCWLTSLALIPIQLWAAAAGGMSVSLGMGFAGMFAGVFLAPEKYWVFCPWSWPVRLMCPIIGVHPNGVLLSPDSPLRNASVIWAGTVLSLGIFLVLTLLTGIWFERREVA